MTAAVVAATPPGVPVSQFGAAAIVDVVAAFEETLRQAADGVPVAEAA